MPNARRCERFKDGHPLDSFRLPEDAKAFAYWRDQALAAKDANAVMLRAIETAARLRSDAPPDLKSELRRGILADIRIVVDSQEPEVLLSIATLYMDPNVARDDSHALGLR